MIAPILFTRRAEAPSPKEITVARDFEALFIAQMLRAAHAAQLAEDPFAGNDTSFRDMQDQLMAKSIAAQSPLGVARLLEARR